MPYHFGRRGLATRRRDERPARHRRRPERGYPGGQGGDLRRPAGPAPHRQALLDYVADYRRRAGIGVNSLFGPLDDVAGDAGHVDHPPRVGFFTDTSVCIGCKACEVACKQWNEVPAAEHLDLLGMSHDNTGALGANAWRHVAFIEQPVPSVPTGPRAARRPGRPRPGMPHRRGRPALADGVGRLQALHARGLPGRLPDRRAVPHRVRLRRRAAGHLQRLRLLRVGVPVRRDRAARRATGARRSARSATTGCTAASNRPAPRPAPPSRSSSASSTSCANAPRRGSPRCTSAASHARPGSTAPTSTTASAATARSSCSSTSRRCTGCRRTRSCPPATAVRMWKFVGRGRRGVPRRGRGLVPGAPMRVSGGSRTPRAACAHCGQICADPRRCARARGARRAGVRGEPPGGAAAAAAAGRPLLLRAAHPQAARLGLADPRLPVRGRAVRRVRRCSSVGADLTGRPALRRRARVAAVAGAGREHVLPGVATSAGPLRFHHMLRVAKPTSPMSVGTWILAAYSPGIGLAAAAELLPARWRAHPAGCGGWPGLRRCRRPRSRPRWRRYTAVLLSQTAVPAWNTAHPYLPFVFTGSAAASSGGLGDGARAARGGGPGPHVRGGRGGGRARGVAGDGAPDRDGRRGLHHGPGAHAAALVGVPDGGRPRGHPAGPAQPRGRRGGRARAGGRQRAAAVRRLRGGRRVHPRPALRRHAAARAAGGRRRSRRGG